MRVLVLRSCRMPQFTVAVTRVRELHPGAEIWTLTNANLAAAATGAGVDRVIPHNVSRMTAWHLGFRLVWQLRRNRFDEVVVPLMEAQLGGATNLLRLCMLIGAARTSVCVDGEFRKTWQRQQLPWLTLKAMLADLVTLAHMVRAACHRRPSRIGRPHRRPRVLHIINSLDVGGAQAQFAELVNRSPGAFMIDVLVLAKGEGELMRGRLLRPGVSIRYLAEIESLGRNTIDVITEFCRRGDYDVVHTWLTLANLLGAAGARLADVPRIVTSIRSVNPGNFPQWYKWWHHAGDVLSARIADVITVNADPLVEDHARWSLISKRRIHVVHNGVDTSNLRLDRAACMDRLRRELAVDTLTPLVGCVGRLSVEKDQATFIQALALLRDRGVTCHGVLVGDGADRASLGKLVDRLALTERLTFLGARRDARQVIAGLDLLALTSRVEGFPNVLLEAGFLGVPIVSTDAGGVIDVVGKGTPLCDPGDPESVANAIEETLSLPTHAAAKATRQRQRCHARFTAEHMVDRWLSLYGSIATDSDAAA